MVSKNTLFDIIAEAFGVQSQEVAVTVDIEQQSDEELLDTLEEIFG